ncbi:MIC19/MIC25 domain-containing protein [Devosia sp.]|uniref:portal protein n=1 Tax=Devosia sp. TaxID=1871048 RepID=UPI0026125B0C|nr:MIC19/MIC25 domain-containing protein [Devosia sp.]
MTEDQLLALTDLEIRNAVGAYGGRLSEQRRKAEYYYLGEAKGDLSPPEVEGRSTVVDTYVRNTIEAMLPQLMEKFTGGEHVVEFEPQLPGPDEDRAKNATEYLNYLFWKKNRGHTVAETWMRDALLQKNGIIKVWWDTRTEETKEEYKGLSQVELAQILDDEEVEPTEQKTYPDEDDAKQRQEAIQHLTQQLQQAAMQPPPPQQPPQPGQPPQQPPPSPAQQIQAQIQHIQSQPPVMLYDITCKRSKKGGKLSIENVPPEEFLIGRKAKSIATATFCGHKVRRSISELRSMGYPEDVLTNLSGDDGAAAFNGEAVERASYDDEMAYLDLEGNNTSDESQRQVWVTECYVRCDWDGDGISELRKVTRCGNKILDNEEVDVAPFADIVCVRQPHKFAGLSIADLGMQTQKLKTGLLRSMQDNQNLQTNGRYFAVDGQVNLDDLLTSRPGGVVRIKSQGAVGALDQARGDLAGAMSLLEYTEQFGEAATGWTRNSQGNAAGPLMSGTATGANIVAAKDDMRVDLIARNFAEGFVEMFRLMLKLVCQHQDKKTEIRLNGSWVDMDPREWRNQFDVNINVGLGAGTKDQKMQFLQAIIQQQEKVHAVGAASPANIYNASAELAKLAGQKNADKFFSDPAKQPKQPPKPDPEAIKAQGAQQLAQTNGQVQMQIEQGKGQVTMQVESAKLQAQMQLEQHKAELQAQVDQSEQQAQQAQTTMQQQIDAQLQREKAQQDLQLEQQRMQHEREMKAMELQAEGIERERDRATKVLIAQIMAKQSGDNAMLAAESKADTVAAE